MSSSLALTQTAFRPSADETLFCDLVVVGDTLAAYSAAIAILQAGGRVCWVKAGGLTTGLADLDDRASPLQALERRFPRTAIAPAQFCLSARQHQFWRQWRSWQQLSAVEPPGALDSPPPTAPLPELPTEVSRAIAPYLSTHQLVLILQAQPLRVLHSATRQRRRVYQVVFRDRRTGQPFRIHAKLTLDATPRGTLGQSLTAGAPVETVLKLTTDHLAPLKRGAARGACFDDTIGLAIALSPHPEARRLRPVTLPLRSLVPLHTEGYLCVSQPGTTPDLADMVQTPLVQWGLGEAAGFVAVQALQAQQPLDLLVQTQDWLRRVQGGLVQAGIPLFWFDDVGHHDLDFAAIQSLAVVDSMRTMRDRDLSFRPETPVTRAVVASALVRLLKKPACTPSEPLSDVTPYHWAFSAIQTVVATGLMPVLGDRTFGPDRVLTQRELWETLRAVSPDAPLTTDTLETAAPDESPARRRHLARWLYPFLRDRQ